MTWTFSLSKGPTERISSSALPGPVPGVHSRFESGFAESVLLQDFLCRTRAHESDKLFRFRLAAASFHQCNGIENRRRRRNLERDSNLAGQDGGIGSIDECRIDFASGHIVETLPYVLRVDDFFLQGVPDTRCLQRRLAVSAHRNAVGISRRDMREFVPGQFAQ